MCDGVDDCPLGEDENLEDWFTFEDVFTGSFNSSFVRAQLRLWGEQYLGSSSGTGTLEEKIGAICVKADSKTFLLYTLLVCTVVTVVILLPATCLVNSFQNIFILYLISIGSGPQKARPNNDAQVT